ncbi:MAG: tetratricopeptide repeat protein [Clostridia bacterium]|nr:tetratricopeptide repeat protein [Clostridia bacterium]
MATFQIIAKDQVNVDQKPRVYFTCHPEDFDKYFEKISNDIFATHNCAIYYTEDMTQEVSKEEAEVTIHRCNLVVVPVTYKLLSSPNRAMDYDIPYAFQHGMPVLPFIMEHGIDAFYAQKDKFDNRQYLDPYSTDLTAISYAEKLRKYLESVLVSDELSKRIREAFNAYVFLSYRKTDRGYANKLMHKIHQNPEYRDVAIWFDEFLALGENFQLDIEQHLNDSELFVLLVTPRTTQKVMNDKGQKVDNYVMSTELPMAQSIKRLKQERGEAGGDILPVQMENISDEERCILCDKDVADIVNAEDDVDFHHRLSGALSQANINGSNDDPEHMYLMGVAYFEGIDMEVDRERGLELINRAAEADQAEAMKKLVTLHYYVNTGEGWQKALYWAERLLQHNERELGTTHKETILQRLNVAVIHGTLGNNNAAYHIAKKVVTQCEEHCGERHPYTYEARRLLVSICRSIDCQQEALEVCEKLFFASCKINGKNAYETIKVLLLLCEILVSMEKLDAVQHIQLTAVNLLIGLLGEKHPESITAYAGLISMYTAQEEYGEAYRTAKRVYELRCEILGEEHPDTIFALDKYADCDVGENALLSAQKAYLLSCKVLGTHHPDTLSRASFLAQRYCDRYQYQKGHALLEETYAAQCKYLGEKHIDTIASLSIKAKILCEKKKYGCALKCYERVYMLRCETLGENHRQTLAALHDMALVLSKQGDGKAAIKLIKKLYRIERTRFGCVSAQALETAEWLQEECLKNGRYAEWFFLFLSHWICYIGFRMFDRIRFDELKAETNMLYDFLYHDLNVKIWDKTTKEFRQAKKEYMKKARKNKRQ